MKIQKVTPKLSELSSEHIIVIEEAAEYHDVPFGALPVDSFSEGALIREACAQYWEPNYRARGVGKRGPSVSALQQIFDNVKAEGFQHRNHKSYQGYDFNIEISVILTYPLNLHWDARVRLPVNRLGEIFAIAHDMYSHIYDLDNAKWQAEGHQDKAPRVAAKCINRARGEHVWGHDMSDLVFESVGFLRNQDWPKGEREQRVFTLEDVSEEMESGSRPDPKTETVLMALDKEKHAEDSLFIGTFLFGIGS